MRTDTTKTGTSQRAQIVDLMRDGEWRTLKTIHRALPRIYPTSASAKLRDLRKPQYSASFGVRYVQSRMRSDRVWEYRLVSEPQRKESAK